MRQTHNTRAVLEQIRMFLIALEEGSLNRAAARLRMSQSALSRQMQALEAEIGGPLLERTSAGVRPTAAGHALAASMPPVLREFEAGVAAARRMARGQRDLLRIGYLGSAAQIFLDPALGALRQRHPEVKVRLSDQTPGEQITALRAGEIDLGIIGQEGALLANEFYTRKLASIPIVAVLPAAHSLAAELQISLHQLQGENFVASPEEDLPGRDRWITQLCRRAGFRPPFAAAAQSLSHAISTVAGDDVVALVPGYVRSLPTAGVAMIPLADDFARWDLLVVWQRGRSLGPLQDLLECLALVAEEVCRREEGTSPPKPDASITNENGSPGNFR